MPSIVINPVTLAPTATMAPVAMMWSLEDRTVAARLRLQGGAEAVYGGGRQRYR